MIFMNNAENLKNAVSSIDDEALRIKVEAVMMALGISPNALGQKFNDMSFIRNTVMNLSDQDLVGIISAVGTENAQNILKDIHGK